MKKGKKKDKGDHAGLCFVTFEDKPKARRQHRRSRKSLCSMAMEDKEDSSSSDSHSDDEKVTSREIELCELLKENSVELKHRERLLRKANKVVDTLTSELVEAKSKIESLSTSSLSSSAECLSCKSLQSDLLELKSEYAKREEERNSFMDELASARDELRAVLASTASSCSDCPHLRETLAELRGECGRQKSKAERVSAELAKSKAELLKLEKAKAKVSDCEVCAAQGEVMSALREESANVENKNIYLRQILSWVSAREPQLGMIIQQFKREDGFGVGYTYTKADFESALSKAVEWSKLSAEERYPRTHATVSSESLQPVDGVIHEKPRTPPKKPVWVPKPKNLTTPLDSLPGPSTTKEPPKATKPKKPKTPAHPKKSQFHCEFCKRQGHLEEFCFRRKRLERVERAQARQDSFYQQGGRKRVPRFQRRGERLEARARRSGGGRGAGFGRRAPGGGVRSGGGPGHLVGCSGPHGRDFAQFRSPYQTASVFTPNCFTPGVFPSFEQMARHWFSSFANPSVGPYAHSFDH